MFVKTAVGAVAVALSLLATVAHAQGGPGRVGFVATERLYADSALARSIDARITADFAGRDKSNQELFARLKRETAQFDNEAAARYYTGDKRCGNSSLMRLADCNDSRSRASFSR